MTPIRRETECRVFGLVARPVLAVVGAAALAASSLSAVGAASPPQSEADPEPFRMERVADAKGVVDLEPLESPSGRPATREVETAAELGDFSNPPLQGDALARAELGLATDIAAGRTPKDDSFDAERSDKLEAETTRQIEVYENGNGTRTAVLSAGPERFKDPDGQWVGYDLTPARADDGSHRAAASDLDVTVPADPAKDGLVVARHGDDAVAFGLPAVVGTVNGSPRVGDDELSPNGHVAVEGDGGVSAAVTLTTGGFEQQVAFPTRDRLDGNGYEVTVDLPSGWRARQGAMETNRVEFIDGAGALVSTFSSGLVWDASGASMADHRTGDAIISLVSAGSGRALINISADPRWLDEATFPVTIDPTYTYTFTGSSTWADTFAARGLSTPMENGVYLSAGKSATIGWAGDLPQVPASGARYRHAHTADAAGPVDGHRVGGATSSGSTRTTRVRRRSGTSR